MPKAAVQAVPDDEAAQEVGSKLDTLTAFETAQAERKAGQSITTLGSDVYPQVGLIGALGWVFAKRQEPTLTYDGYMQSHTVDQITRELGLSGGQDEEGKAEASD